MGVIWRGSPCMKESIPPLPSFFANGFCWVQREEEKEEEEEEEGGGVMINPLRKWFGWVGGMAKST